MKRILAVILLLSLLSLTACGSASSPVTENVSENDTPPTASDDTSEPDFLYGLNYDGAEFNILTSDTTISSNYLIEGSGELNGESVNDAVYERNMVTEDSLGVSFIYTHSDNKWDGVAAAMEKLVMAGDGTYDLVIDDQLGFSTASVNHLLYDVSGLRTIDITENCWWTDYMMNLSVDYKTINLLVGDYFMDVLNHSHALLVNRDLYRTLNGEPDDLYRLVQDGAWTYEAWLPMIESAYADLDGSGKADSGDRFGMIVGGIGGSSFPFTYGSDCSFVTRDANGYPTLTMYSDRLVKLYDNIRSVFYNDGTFTKYEENGNDLHTKFKAGEALFVSGTMLGDFGTFRDMKEDIGIIPYPKLDESQADYVTVVHDTAEVGVLPLTVRDPEMSGAVVTTLCRNSHETVLPVYYEESLKIKYARDDTSAAMIDLIHDGVTDMFCLVYGASWANNIFTWAILEPLQKNGDSITSAYESRESAALEGLEKLASAFSGN